MKVIYTTSRPDPNIFLVTHFPFQNNLRSHKLIMVVTLKDRGACVLSDAQSKDIPKIHFQRMTQKAILDALH